MGSAWGEWSAHDFSSPALRQKIATASGGVLPLEHAPRGLERLSSLWTAPMPRYAPAFIPSAPLGYAVSAVIGVAIIILLFVVLNRLLSRFSRRRSVGFIERTARALLDTVERSLFAEKIARFDGLLQRFDPRVKMAGFAGLGLAALLSRNLPILVGLLVLGAIFGLLSRVSLYSLVGRVWLSVLAFTGLIALPAVFLIPGATLYRVPWLNWPVHLQGVYSASFLILRGEVLTTLSVLLVLTTPWAQVLKALRFFRVPAVCVVLLGMTYRYIFLLMQTVSEMFEARRARLVGSLDGREGRRLTAGTGGVLLAKSFHLVQEVHLAMLARGFRGEIHTLDAPALRWLDWAWLSLLFAIAVLAFWAGR